MEEQEKDTIDLMSKANFNVLYDGPALVSHEMNVNDLAPALLALGEVIEAANDTLNGSKRAKVALNVKASFKTGCFGIELDLVQTLTQQIGALFSAAQAVTAQDMLRWLGLVWDNGDKAIAYTGGLMWLLKKLKGRPIKHATRLDNGLVRIKIDDESYILEQEVIELYRNAKLRKSLSDVLRPLEQEGIDEFAVTNKHQSARFITVSSSERDYFSAPDAIVETLPSTEVITNLQLVTVNFRPDNKWRFSEGEHPFYATVLDRDFLRKVQENEAFRAGDRLKVRMRKTQKIVDGTIKIDHEILEVLEHEKGLSQIPILFDDE